MKDSNSDALLDVIAETIVEMNRRRGYTSLKRDFVSAFRKKVKAHSDCIRDEAGRGNGRIVLDDFFNRVQDFHDKLA